MAITNIHLAKHLDNSPVNVKDIHVGLTVYMPCAAGGVVKHQCVAMNEQEAVFDSQDNEWPGSYKITFDAPEFTLEDFNALSEAIKAFSGWNTIPTSEQRAFVCKAQRLGYAWKQSYTQVGWTEKGIEAYKTLLAEDAKSEAVS